MYLYSLARTFCISGSFASLMVLGSTLSINAAPHTAQKLLQSGHNAIVAGKNHQAVSILSSVIQDKRTDKLSLARAFLKRAIAYQRLGHMTHAINNFNYAEDFGVLPKSDVRDLLYNRAISYHYAGHVKQALADKKTLEMIDKKTVWQAAQKRGGRMPGQVASLPKNGLRQVQQPMRKVLPAPTTTASISSTISALPLQQAHQAIIAGQNKQALKILSGLIDTETTAKPLLAQALLKRAVANRRLGKVAAAISDFTHAEDLKILNKSDTRDLLFNRAEAYKVVGMEKLALGDTTKLQKMDGVLPQHDPALSAPLTTASVKGGSRARTASKKRYFKRTIVKAKPKNMAEHLAVLFGQKKK